MSMAGLPQSKKPTSNESERNYLQIPVPRLSSFTSPKWLLVIAFIAVLFSGLLYLGLREYKEGTVTAGKQTIVETHATTVNDAFIDYAKAAKMDTTRFASCLSSHTYKDHVAADIKDGTTGGDIGTPRFLINGTPVLGAQPFAVFQTIIDQELNNPTQSSEKGHLPQLGKTNAKVAIVEFSDFECPFCKQFFNETFSQIKREYIDTGKVAFYFRHYPLTSIHPNAQIAAEATECANEQGKFWQFHDMLFTNQESWANLPQSQAQAT